MPCQNHIQKHCMPKITTCCEGSLVGCCSGIAACLNCPHHSTCRYDPDDPVWLQCSWSLILPPLCSVLRSTTFFFLSLSASVCEAFVPGYMLLTPSTPDGVVGVFVCVWGVLLALNKGNRLFPVYSNFCSFGHHFYQLLLDCIFTKVKTENWEHIKKVQGGQKKMQAFT